MMSKIVYVCYYLLGPFPPFTTNANVFILVVYITNNMDPDQTAPLGVHRSEFIVFASRVMIFWSALFVCLI